MKQNIRFEFEHAINWQKQYQQSQSLHKSGIDINCSICGTPMSVKLKQTLAFKISDLICQNCNGQSIPKQAMIKALQKLHASILNKQLQHFGELMHFK